MSAAQTAMPLQAITPGLAEHALFLAPGTVQALVPHLDVETQQALFATCGAAWSVKADHELYIKWSPRRFLTAVSMPLGEMKVSDPKTLALVQRYSPLVRKLTFGAEDEMRRVHTSLNALSQRDTLFPNLVHATVHMGMRSDPSVHICLPRTLTTLELTWRLTNNEVDNRNAARDALLRKLSELRKLVFTAERKKTSKGQTPAPLLTLAECIPFDACPKLLELEIRDKRPLVYAAADLAAFCDAHVELTRLVLNPVPTKTAASDEAPRPEVLGVLAEKASAKLHKLVAFECYVDGDAPVPQTRPRVPADWYPALERVSVGATKNGWRLEGHVRALVGSRVKFFHDEAHCASPAT